jgi:hypothetical protein
MHTTYTVETLLGPVELTPTSGHHIYMSGDVVVTNGTEYRTNLYFNLIGGVWLMTNTSYITRTDWQNRNPPARRRAAHLKAIEKAFAEACAAWAARNPQPLSNATVAHTTRIREEINEEIVALEAKLVSAKAQLAALQS